MVSNSLRRLRLHGVPGSVLLCALAVAGCNRTHSSRANAQVEISEVMAANRGYPVLDDAGKVVNRDWVEVHNLGSSPVRLDGFSLTDNRSNPGKFRFPRGTILPPNGYLLVFAFSEERCDENCEEDVRTCAAQCAAGDDSCIVACQESRASCLEDCAPPSGLVADFNLGASGETVYLLSDERDALIDQAGVKNQPDNLSNGRDPDTGEYGVMYVPTPREPNKPANVKLHEFSQQPAALKNECDVEIEIGFSIDRDVAATGELQVKLEWAVVAECGMPGADDAYVSAQLERIIPDGGDELIEDMRTNVQGESTTAMRERLVYRGFIPAAACPANRTYRVSATDALGTIRSSDLCVKVGVRSSKVRINEYQPRNSNPGGIQFSRTNSDNETEISTPDWLEIKNYGTEEEDISQLGLESLADFKAGKHDKIWLFGKHGMVTEPLAPGGLFWVLADGDGGLESNRREYNLVDPRYGDTSRIFYSTPFKLDYNNDNVKNPFDGFVLLDSTTGQALDTAILDFSAHNYEILANQSACRFDNDLPDQLQPGTVTDCPTPEKENLRTCEVPPRFVEVVTVESEGGGRCPPAGAPATVRASFNADSDRTVDQVDVSMGIVLDPPQAPGFEPQIEVSVAEDQGSASAGATLYDVVAMIPGLPAGTLVEFDFTVVDHVLQAENDARPPGSPEIEYMDSLSQLEWTQAESRSHVSFRYLVGYVPPADAPRLNEVVPGTDAESLLYPPPYQDVKEEFAEIFNASEAELDLSGYYLTTMPLPDVGQPDLPIARARHWRFPDGTRLPPRGFLPVFFGPPPAPPAPPVPGYIQVEGFNLSCKDGDVLYLLAPDDRERGGNCVVDSIRWRLAEDDGNGGTQCKSNTAVGRICDGCTDPKCVLELSRPSPGASNSETGLPLLFFDAFHQSQPLPPAPPAPRNACVEPTESVLLTAVYFVDPAIIAAFGQGGKISAASFFVDRGTGSGEEEHKVRGFGGVIKTCPLEPNDCADTPSDYENGSVSVSVFPPLGPVVRYRVQIVDACGSVLEAGPFSFGTTASEHPMLVINELNRFFPVPGDASQTERPWIELYNPGTVEVDASGMSLSDNNANPRKAVLPAGVRIPPGSTQLILTTPGGALTYPDVDLDWQHRDRGILYLFDTDERAGCTLDFIDFDFMDLSAGESLGRTPDGTGSLVELAEPSPGTRNVSGATAFLRGDANNDTKINVTDMIRLLSILFQGDDRRPPCDDALDADDNGSINATDPVYLGNFLFRFGTTLPPPFPTPGEDPTADSLPPCGD